MGFLFGQSAVEPKPKVRPAYTEQQKKDVWRALAPGIKKHFDTGDKTVKEIAADLALADYYNSLKKDEK